MLLAFRPVAASHVPGEGFLDISMTPSQYVSYNVTGYLKSWIDTYRVDDGKVDGFAVDLPSYLYTMWCRDQEAEEMACSLSEDCDMPPRSKLLGEDDGVALQVSKTMD